MDEAAYRAFYESVGQKNGWDFSRLQVETRGEAWDFSREVLQRCQPTALMLDIGTGGGEAVLQYASQTLLLIGIDHSVAMIEKAKENLVSSPHRNVRFFHMDSFALVFPNEFFDLVTSRHAPFDPWEVARVLKPGGVFLSQQVSEHDKYKLKNAFGRGQCYGDEDGVLRDSYLRELQAAGLAVEVREYDAEEYYQSVQDLLFLLSHTPIIPAFGECADDFKRLHTYVKKNQTEQGIRTNAKRFLLIGTKRQ